MTVAPRRLKSAVKVVSAALLFAGLLLGSPIVTEDVSAATNPDCPPRGCIKSGECESCGTTVQTGLGSSYDATGGVDLMAIEG